ncbi:MAG TPA: cyclodeaminase/cyclohydrolase family protein [Gaiellaceae bacterium]|nr:cyclodeaminase/cyclohydrolase family protein [Gaiellaceae bacterium]
MLTGLSLPALLEELAAPREVPGAGSALAVALAAAAAVVQMTARLSPESWAEAAGVAAQADSLRERAARLVDEDAEAYGRALEARAAVDEGQKPESRDWALGQVTAAAAEPPLDLARLAADVAELCAAAGPRVEVRVHADVAAAAALAAAVARGARELVAVNLTALPGDGRIEEADRLVAVADAAAARVAGA